MTIQELRAAYKKAFADAKAALEAEPFDADEATKLNDEAKALHRRIKDWEELTANEPKKEPKKGLVAVVADEEDKKKAVKQWGMGEFLHAVAMAPDSIRAYQSDTEPGHYDLSKALGFKAIGSLPSARDKVRKAKAITGLSESVPADGGFLVQTDWGGALMERVYAVGQILQRVNINPISANANGITYYGYNETSRVDGSRRGGIRFYWLSEGAEKTISHQTYRKIELQLNKAIVRVPATDELLQDTVALESEIMRLAPEEIAFGVEAAIVNVGTGAGQPLSVLNSPALVSVPAETGQAAATIVSENVINMWARRWAGYRDYVWLINQDVTPQLLQMNLGVGTGGQLTYMPAGGLSGLPYGTLMGRPVLEVEYCPTLGTVGDIILWAPQSYRAIDKGGVQSASSIHVRWEFDETEFRFVYRVDGQPEVQAALTPYQGTNTQSPMVVLATRS
jgi:HK97 family phage major capsid protein